MSSLWVCQHIADRYTLPTPCHTESFITLTHAQRHIPSYAHTHPITSLHTTPHNQPSVAMLLNLHSAGVLVIHTSRGCATPACVYQIADTGMCYNMMQLCIHVVVVYCTDPHLSDIVHGWWVYCFLLFFCWGVSFILNNTSNHCCLVMCESTSVSIVQPRSWLNQQQCGNMPCTISKQTCISLGGRTLWKVRPCLIQLIGGVEYIKLPAYDSGLCLVVAEGIVDKIPKNASLSSCSGFVELMKLRNEQSAAPVSALFDALEHSAPKRQRMSAQDRQLMRDEPTIMQVNVEGTIIPMVRPAGPRDELCVQLTNTIFEFVCNYIRDKGISEDTLQVKRAYRSEPDLPKGVYRTKNNNFVIKLGPDSQNKYKRVGSLEEVQKALVSEGGQIMDVGSDAEDGDDDEPMAEAESGAE
jgi:hypothetical protein